MTAEQLLTAALSNVESESIRQWATTEHNRPIFLKISQGYIDRALASGKEPDVHVLSSYIMCLAIGL